MIDYEHHFSYDRKHIVISWKNLSGYVEKNLSRGNMMGKAVLVKTAEDRKSRQQELKSIEKKEALEREEARKNKGFTQVYAAGWKRVLKLSQRNPGAAGLYAFFAEHMDPGCGAVVCDQQFLADQFEVSTRTIRSRLKYLEDQNALIRIPVAGRVCAYALDPHEVWKGYDNAKNYAAFMTKTLVNKDGNIQRRIMSMFKPENED